MDLANEVFGLYLHPDDRLKLINLDFISKDAFSFIFRLDEHVSYFEGIVEALLGRDIGWFEFFQRFHHFFLGKFMDLLRGKCTILQGFATGLVTCFEGQLLRLFVLVQQLEELVVFLLGHLLVLFGLFFGIKVDVVILVLDGEAVALAQLLSLLLELIGLLFVKLVSFAYVAYISPFLLDFAIFHLLEILLIEFF